MHRRVIGALLVGLLGLTLGCETTPTPEPKVVKERATAGPIDPKKLGRAIRRADALTAQGRTDELLPAVCANPGPAQKELCGFVATYALHDRNQAWKAFNRKAKANARDPYAQLGMQLIYIEWKIDDQAQQSYERAIARDSRLAIAHARIGTAYARRGQDDLARAQFELALREDPEDADALMGLARLSVKEGDETVALDNLRLASNAWPESPTPALEAATLCEQQGNTDAARAFYREAADRAPRSVDIRRTLAALLVRSEQLEAARAVYEEAVAIDPAHFQTLVALAQLCSKIGDKAATFEFYRRAAEAKEDDIEVQRAVGRGYLDRDEMAGAERAFAQVIKLSPEDPEAHLALARINVKAERLRDAVGHYRAALAAAPDPAANAERVTLEKRLHISPTPAKGRTVNATFDAALKHILTTYKKRLKEQPGLEGDVTLEVTIAPEGRVIRIKVLEDTLKDEPLLSCIYWSIHDAKFPRAKQKRHFTYPLTFSR